MPQTITIKPANEPAQKRQIAELLFEKDQPFIPVTSLGSLHGPAPFFFGATLEPDGAVRATASYSEWLSGCNRGEMPGTADTTVFELASSLVRDPLGGFEAPVPTMQQTLTFARLMAIMGADLFPREMDEPSSQDGTCIITAIARQNRRSRDGMLAAGMTKVEALPRWLQYEHRSWFQKLDSDRDRNVEQEAEYFWFSESAVRIFMTFMAPYVDGKPLSRQSRRDKSVTEEFLLVFDIPVVARLIKAFGSLQAAADRVDLTRLRPPPDLAIIGDGTF
jgi:hypothetical protein